MPNHEVSPQSENVYAGVGGEGKGRGGPENENIEARGGGGCRAARPLLPDTYACYDTFYGSRQ